MDQASATAYLALLLVVPLTVIAFHRYRPVHAFLLVFLGGLLFLPERVSMDFPLLPPFDKQSIPALALLVGIFVKAKQRLAEARPGRGMDLLILGAALAVLGTIVTNRDPLTYGPRTIRGLDWGDALSYTSNLVLGPGATFFLGRVLFRSTDDARDLLKALAMAGVIYAPFVLIELRLSPQWHNWIYGFAQHSFLQVYRGGGWRPMCFMAHGLALALFICIAAYSAWQLAKTRTRIFGMPARLVAVGLTVLLALLNSVGALVFGIVAVLMSWFLTPRIQLWIACSLAILIALYPWMRTTGFFPAQDLVDLVARASQDRAGSLHFRFFNEDQLLQKALERPFFGWGGWGRNFVFQETGTTASVIDGAWILDISSWGLVGFSFRFGLLLIPIFVATKRLNAIAVEDRPLLAGVALAATLYALDLLPNGMFNDMPTLLSGAVLGLATGMHKKSRAGLDVNMLVRWVTASRRAREMAATHTSVPSP